MKVPIEISLIIPRCIRNLRMLALKKYSHTPLPITSPNFPRIFPYVSNTKKKISLLETLCKRVSTTIYLTEYISLQTFISWKNVRKS